MSRRSSSVMGTMTSRSPSLPKVRTLATSVSVKRLNWTLLRGLTAGITGLARLVCILGAMESTRWMIPVGGGLLAAILIVIGTPHVAWYLRLFLALIAFVYIAGQSAAYLWSSNPDHG